MAEKSESNMSKEFMNQTKAFCEWHSKEKNTEEKSQEAISGLSIKLNLDCADALKGLKAVTRAAKKATAALKELDDVQRKVSSISITLDGKAIGGMLTKHSELAKRLGK